MGVCERGWREGPSAATPLSLQGLSAVAKLVTHKLDIPDLSFKILRK